MSCPRRRPPAPRPPQTCTGASRTARSTYSSGASRVGRRARLSFPRLRRCPRVKALTLALALAPTPTLTPTPTPSPTPTLTPTLTLTHRSRRASASCSTSSAAAAPPCPRAHTQACAARPRGHEADRRPPRAGTPSTTPSVCPLLPPFGHGRGLHRRSGGCAAGREGAVCCICPSGEGRTALLRRHVCSRLNDGGSGAGAIGQRGVAEWPWAWGAWAYAPSVRLSR